MTAAVIYYGFLAGGLYLAEVLVPYLFWLPRSWNVVEKLKVGDFGELVLTKLTNKESVRRIRFETLFVLGFFATSAWLYRDRLELLAAILAVRALLISALDYIYHYETPVGDPTHAMDLLAEAQFREVHSSPGPSIGRGCLVLSGRESSGFSNETLEGAAHVIYVASLPKRGDR